MTRDEFMDLVYDELYDDGDNNRANRIIDAADSYAEECTPHWIPVDEKLPEKGKDVLFRDVDGDIYCGYLSPYGKTPRWMPYFGYYDVKNIISWMPLSKIANDIVR